jgi:hypothetical protein
VELLASKERREARQHAATWKLLSAFSQKRVQPEVPPSSVYEHYRNISQVPGAPLSTEEVQATFIGPLTREDSELEGDVSNQEARAALEAVNKNSAPGPDGLTARLITKFLSLPLMIAFLARFLNRCFRCAFTPAQWRTSENFVLYKGVGAIADVSSFRAISLTQALAKVEDFLVFCFNSVFPFNSELTRVCYGWLVFTS